MDAEHPVTGPSLANLRGSDRNRRRLILNCDDLGVSHSANVAIYRAMTEGLATSATLMVPCPWAREAADMFAGLAVGVHLTLTSEYRGYRWRGLTGGKSLHDADGYLAATTEAALAHLDPDEVLTECREQIERALFWGVDVTHIDSHMDVLFSRPDLFERYVMLAEAFRLPIRRPARAADRRLGFDATKRARDRGIMFPDRLIYPWPDRSKDILLAEAAELPAGISEIFFHPVAEGAELRAYDPDYAHIRLHDAECLVDNEVRWDCQDFRVRGGHNGREGVPLCHDARSR